MQRRLLPGGSLLALTGSAHVASAHATAGGVPERGGVLVLVLVLLLRRRLVLLWLLLRSVLPALLQVRKLHSVFSAGHFSFL